MQQITYKIRIKEKFLHKNTKTGLTSVSPGAILAPFQTGRNRKRRKLTMKKIVALMLALVLALSAALAAAETITVAIAGCAMDT